MLTGAAAPLGPAPLPAQPKLVPRLVERLRHDALGDHPDRRPVDVQHEGVGVRRPLSGAAARGFR
jgi:hypothetical protein